MFAPAQLGPGPGEDLCCLSGDWHILQRVDGHRWSLDDLVVAWAALREVGERPPRRAADLGCGIGSVLLMVAWRFPGAEVIGVEAQAVSVDLARRSIAWNDAEARCRVRLGDLRDPATMPEGAVFDLVTATPPYLPPGTANESSKIQWGPCHIEKRGGIEEYCRAAARLLAPGGVFVTSAGGRDRARVERGAAEAGLSLVRRLDVLPRAGKPVLFSVHALRRRGEAGALEVDEPLTVRDAAGRRTPRCRELRLEMGMPA